VTVNEQLTLREQLTTARGEERLAIFPLSQLLLALPLPLSPLGKQNKLKIIV